MQKLNSRQKITLKFSSLLVGLITITSCLFYLIFKFSLFYQIDNQVQTMVKDVIASHLKLENGKINFVTDKNGKVLTEELIDPGFSAVFFDENQNLISGFGSFAFLNSNPNQEEINSLYKNVYEVSNNKNYIQQILKLHNTRIYTYTIPLISDNQFYGTAVIGKNIESVYMSLRLATAVLLVVILLSIISSLFLGNNLTNLFFNPIKKLSKHIGNLNLDKLDKQLKINLSDLDEIVVLTNKYNDMIKRLKISSDLQKNFVTNVSHELKTPLTKAVSSIEVIQLKNKDKSLEKIKNDLVEISEIINNILKINQIKKGDKSNLYKILKEIKNYKKTDLIKRKINLVFRFNKSINLPISSENAQIIFSNLVGNAIKFSRKNSKIKINAFSKNKKIIVEVSDEGEGIEKRDIKNIFKLFVRGKTNKKGSGVGLSLVKQICDLNGVKLDINSTKDKGTKVRLTF